MKKIQKTRESYYDVFVAYDGTEFTNSDECKKYEESARGVLMAKIKPLVIQSIDEEDLFGCGCTDNVVWVMKPNKQDDVDTIMQAYLLYNEYMTRDENKDRLERVKKLLQRTIDEDDIIFVGRGYDSDGFWFYGTPNSIKDDLSKRGVVEKKDDNA